MPWVVKDSPCCPVVEIITASKWGSFSRVGDPHSKNKIASCAAFFIASLITISTVSKGICIWAFQNKYGSGRFGIVVFCTENINESVELILRMLTVTVRW